MYHVTIYLKSRSNEKLEDIIESESRVLLVDRKELPAKLQIFSFSLRKYWAEPLHRLVRAYIPNVAVTVSL
jgi:hypothetical protein